MLAVAIGTVGIPFATVVQVILSHLLPGSVEATWSPTQDQIIWQFRLPRALLAVIVGAALAISGTVLQAIAAALRRVNMGAFAERQFNMLSGGEKQHVLVARALAQQPRFLVLDEPTNHLDIHYQLEILELVKSLGITTLITLHDLNLAAAYCARLYMLGTGRIVAAGVPEEVLTPARLREVFLVDAVTGRHPVTGTLQLSFVATPHQHTEEQ